jgi:hypothetical protein
MKKTLIIVFVSFLALFIFLLLLVNNSKNNYVIFDNNLFLSINNNKILEVSSESLYNQTYHAFYQKEYIGKYELYNIDDEYGKLFFSNSESSDAYSFETPYLAVTSGIEVVPFEILDGEITDLSFLTYDFDKHWIESVDDLDLFKKIVFDVDNDNVDEVIYYASYWNELDDGLDYDTSFSIVFLVDNNKVHLLNEANPYETYIEEDEAFYTMDSLALEYLFEVDNSIMMVVSIKSTDVSFYSIYEFNGESLICNYS